MEWFWQFRGFASGRDFPLLHRLEHRSLSLGRSAVYLVCEEKVCENRPRHELKLTRAFHRIVLQDLCTRDVRRHEVWCELDSIKIQIEDGGQRSYEQGLCQAWNTCE